MFPDVATFLPCKDFKVRQKPGVKCHVMGHNSQGKFVLVSDSRVNGNFMIQHFLVQQLKSEYLFGHCVSIRR